MRNSHTRDSVLHSDNRYIDEPQIAGYEYPNYGQRAQEGETVAGFTRHQSSNSRRTASRNLFSTVTKHIGAGVSNLLESRPRRIQEPSGRPSRAPSAGPSDDYLGVGPACHSCGKPVDAAQTRCPHCGAFVKPLYQNIIFWIVVVVFISLVTALTIAINSCNSREALSEDQSVNDATQQPAQEDPTPIDRNTLSSAVSDAESILSNQSSTHTYTRYSATVLQAAVDNANAVLLDEAATDGQITNAYQQLNEANNALAEMATDVQSADYADLSANLSNYIGQRVILAGTALIVTPNDNGSVSVQMAVSGDSNAIVYVDYLPEDALGDLAVGDSFTVNGTVSNEAYGSPVIQADRIEVQ